MNYYLIRLLRVLVCAFIILTLNFLLPRFIPGNPVIAMLGQDAAVLSAEEMSVLKQDLGLDKPLGTQYVDYLKSLIQGDLGYSYHSRKEVAILLEKHLGWTLWLIMPSIILSSLLAVFLGSVAGWRKGKRTDTFLTGIFVAVYSLPQFLVGMLLLSIFGFHLGWFPLGGLKTPGIQPGTLQAFIDTAKHLFLPVATLTLSSTPPKFLVVRNAVARALAEDYVIYAKAKGLKNKRILFVHILKNTCLPLVSMIALNLGYLVSGALLVEVVFSINGMGVLIYEAALYRDYPVLQSCFMVLTLVVICLNFLADIVSGVLDPRIRKAVVPAGRWS